MSASANVEVSTVNDVPCVTKVVGTVAAPVGAWLLGSEIAIDSGVMALPSYDVSGLTTVKANVEATLLPSTLPSLLACTVTVCTVA